MRLTAIGSLLLLKFLYAPFFTITTTEALEQEDRRLLQEAGWYQKHDRYLDVQEPTPRATVLATEQVDLTITVPNNQNLNADAEDGTASVLMAVTMYGSDADLAGLSCTSTDTKGDTTTYTLNEAYDFPAGTTTVTCTANDEYTGEALKSEAFTISVTDITPPVIDQHASVSYLVHNTSTSVDFAVTAHDNVDGDLSSTSDNPLKVICDPASGSRFKNGTTTVTCEGSDAAGNEASPMTFTVVVTEEKQETVGYVFFDFSLATTLPSAVTSSSINVAQTKAILKRAISIPLLIDQSLVTITQLYLGSKTPSNQLTETSRLRHLQSATTLLYADSIIGVEVHTNDVADADGTLAGGAKARFTEMSTELAQSVSSGDLNTNIQESASLLDASSPLASSTLDTSKTNVVSSDGFSYGTSSDRNQARQYSFGGSKTSSGVAIGVGVAMAILGVGALAGLYVYHKRRVAGDRVHNDAE